MLSTTLARSGACAALMYVACSTGAIAGLPVAVETVAEHDGDPASLDLADGSWFGFGTTFLPDLDGDGFGELAVGAIENEILDASGTVRILFLKGDGSLKSSLEIGNGQGGLPAGSLAGERFGIELAWLGDLGVPSEPAPTPFALAVGQSHGVDSGGTKTGVVWILFLNDDASQGPIGEVVSHVRIANGSGNLPTGTLDMMDGFGNGLCELPDLDANGVRDLAVGAPGDDDGVTVGVNDQAGAVWIVFLKHDGTVASTQKISQLEGNGPPLFSDHEFFGDSLSYLGDLSAPGSDAATPHAVAVGSSFGNDQGPQGKGNVRILFLHDAQSIEGPLAIRGAAPGMVQDHSLIASGVVGGLPAGALQDGDHFGRSVAATGDLDGNGVCDIAVGANLTDDGGQNAGALWLVALESNGRARPGYVKKISAIDSCFEGALISDDRFGESVASGDFNGDGKIDIAVGCSKDDHGSLGSNDGSVWMLSLAACSQASWLNVGAGTMGSRCVPSLSLSAAPIMGTSVEIEIGNCFYQSNPTTAFLFLGVQSAAIPAYGGTLVLHPILTLPVVVGSEGASIGIDIPCDAALCGFVTRLQGLQLDPQVPFGLAWTPGLEMTIGG